MGAVYFTREIINAFVSIAYELEQANKLRQQELEVLNKIKEALEV